MLAMVIGIVMAVDNDGHGGTDNHTDINGYDGNPY